MKDPLLPNNPLRNLTSPQGYVTLSPNKWAEQSRLPKTFDSPAEGGIVEQGHSRVVDLTNLRREVEKTAAQSSGPRLQGGKPWSDKKIQAFLDRWLKHPDGQSVAGCDREGLLKAIEPRLVDAWEHGREAERKVLLELKERLERGQ